MAVDALRTLRVNARPPQGRRSLPRSDATHGAKHQSNASNVGEPGTCSKAWWRIHGRKARIENGERTLCNSARALHQMSYLTDFFKCRAWLIAISPSPACNGARCQKQESVLRFLHGGLDAKITTKHCSSQRSSVHGLLKKHAISDCKFLEWGALHIHMSNAWTLLAGSQLPPLFGSYEPINIRYAISLVPPPTFAIFYYQLS